MRCLAVDWSGRRTGAERVIWIAEARDGRLCSLQDGRGREAAVDEVIARSRTDPRLVAGFDFAFSLPAWYCAQRGWRTGPEVWAGIDAEAELLLRDCPPPFWGRPGVPRPHRHARGLRVTDVADVPGAKSVFQIGGTGSVGTGSLRGMGRLTELAAAGFDVWPFDLPPHGRRPPGAAHRPRALEIYPRALYGRGVVKSDPGVRAALLDARFANLPPPLRSRAVDSEDAFDAAVSALVMSRHAAALRGLDAVPVAPVHRLEGRVWTPALSASGV